MTFQRIQRGKNWYYLGEVELPGGFTHPALFTQYEMLAARLRAEKRPVDFAELQPKPEPVSVWRRLFGRGVKG